MVAQHFSSSSDILCILLIHYSLVHISYLGQTHRDGPSVRTDKNDDLDEVQLIPKPANKQIIDTGEEINNHGDRTRILCPAAKDCGQAPEAGRVME